MIRWLFLGLFTLFSAKSFSQVLKKPIPDKLVVLTFDDAVKSHYSTVAPLLKQYGFGATFFVCEFPPDFADTSKYMTWEQIRQLSEMGFEIGNHTKNHVDVGSVPQSELLRELAYIEQKCIALQIPKPVSFAYPGNNAHPSALSVLEKRGYLFARTGGEHAYSPAAEHPSLVPAFTSLSTNRKEIMNAFAEAKQGKVVVLTFHGVPDAVHPWVTTPPELFKEYIKYLHDNGFKVIAMKGLEEYVNIPVALKKIEPVFPSPMSRKKLVALIAAGLGCLVCFFYAFSGLRKKGKI